MLQYNQLDSVLILEYSTFSSWPSQTSVFSICFWNVVWTLFFWTSFKTILNHSVWKNGRSTVSDHQNLNFNYLKYVTIGHSDRQFLVHLLCVFFLWKSCFSKLHVKSFYKSTLKRKTTLKNYCNFKMTPKKHGELWKRWSENLNLLTQPYYANLSLIKMLSLSKSEL